MRGEKLKKRNRIISFVMAIAMVLTLVTVAPVTAQAAEVTNITIHFKNDWGWETPYDDVLRLVLFDYLKESLASLVILFGCASLTRTTHRHLQIVEEDDRVPDLQPHRLIGLLTH